MALNSKLMTDSIYKVRPTVLYRVDNEKRLTILNLEDQCLYSMEGITGYIWLLLDGSKSIDQIISLCSKELKISDKTLRPKILKVIEDIFLKNLIESVNKREKPSKIEPDLKRFFLKNKIKGLKTLTPTNYTAAAGSCGSIGGWGPSCGSYTPPSPP